jgi:hypothetical protein
MGRNQFGPTALAEALVQWIAIVGYIANHAFWRLADKPALDSSFHQLHFLG